METLRANFIHLLRLLASRSDQDRYQSEVSIDISGELICMWFDDFYSPAARRQIVPLLTEQEREAVDAFDSFYDAKVNKLPSNYAEMRETELWAEVVAKAEETVQKLGWDRVPTV